MRISALIATFGSFLILVQAGGGPTQPPLPKGCTIPCMDGVFVLDVSISIKNDENFNLMKDFVTSTFPFVNISQECSHAAVILFAADATIRFDLNEYTDVASLTNAVDEIVYSEIPEDVRTGTNTPAALDLMRTAGQSSVLGLRDDVVHIGMFITDGRPNLKHIDQNISQSEANRRTEVAGNRLHEAEIFDQIYAIGVEGNKPLGQTLEFIADPESLVFPIADFDEDLFMELGRNITLSFCNPCLLRPCPPGSECRICEKTGEPYCVYSCAIDNGGCPEGEQCSEVAIPACQPGQCCSPVNITCGVCDLGRVDCVFVLDNSISIEDDTNFGLIRNLVIQITQQLTIGVENSLVSVLRFARHAAVEFPLTEHTNSNDLTNAINQISYYDLSELERTGTNIPEALDLLVTGGQDGGSIMLRPNASFTHVIFITDGRANTIDLQGEITGMKLTGEARRIQRRIDEANTIAAAERLHDSDIYDEVFAIGIRGTQPISEEQLEAIASRPEFVFQIEGFTEEAFQAVILQLTDEICDPCIGFECPTGSECRVCEETDTAYCAFSCAIDNGGCPEGSTCSEVACPPDQCCSATITCETCELRTDFVFVCDVSISIGNDENFNVIKNFVNAISNFLAIGPDDNLVGKILFARHANISFHVQEHTNAADLTAAIDSIVYSDIPELDRTGTNIPEALDLLRTAGQSGGELQFRDDDTVTKVAVFITDGRPNTKDLTGNTRQEDAQNTEDAAARLHESDVYDQVYAIGVEGNKNVNFRFLESIASDPSLAFIVQDFDEELFEELQRNLTRIFCEQCPVEGQIYSECASCVGRQPNCSDPFPVCTLECQPGCMCPAGTVIDEIQNRCVPLAQCTCPPQCSHDYCQLAFEQRIGDSLVPCMRGPPPHTEADCKDACQLTYCEACYYYPGPDPLPPPPGCVDPSTDDDNCKGCLCCLKEWARCVEPRNERDNPCTGDCQTPGNFKCYAYPPCDS